MLVQIPSTTDAIDDRGRIYKVICSVRTCTVAMHVMCCVRAILALASSTQLQNAFFLWVSSQPGTDLPTHMLHVASVLGNDLYTMYILVVYKATRRSLHCTWYLGNGIDYHCVSECAQ